MSKRLLAIDPGPEESAWLLYDLDERRPIEWAKEPNRAVRYILATWPASQCAIETVQSFGMPMGQTTIETAIWVGRFMETWSRKTGKDPLLLYRKTVVAHLCGTVRAKDANVRQALIDRYGPGRPKAVGTIKHKGPLYDLTGDCMSALAIAVTASENGVANSA